MVEVAQTRELFSALISKPALEDRLLQRPPFKFIHDIVTETIHATGFLSDLFTKDELDSRKAGLNRDTKIAFVQKLVDVLNFDGDLDDVSAAKIVAGKEADRTNQLLQKLAVQAAANNIDRPSKQSRDKKRHRSSSSTPHQPDPKAETPASRERQRQDKKKEIEREKRRLSRAVQKKQTHRTMELTRRPKKVKKIKDSEGREKSKKRSSDEKSSTKDKTREKSRDKSKEKSRDKSRDKSKKRHIEEEREHFVDEGIGSATPHLSQRHEMQSPIPRESSGGTSKAEDSGIAESNEVEAHESGRQSSAILQMAAISERPSRLSNVATPEKLVEDDSRLRPTTAAGRPQTSIGRPGTAAARPAPPRVKKTKIGDVDPTTITLQPAAFEKSAVIADDATEQKNDKNDNDFVLDEEDDAHALTITNANVAAELDAGDEHGALVNKIIANARDIQKESTDEFVGMDSAEAKKLRNDVDQCRESLQSVAQTVQPLSRTLEFINEDFDVLMREIEESRKQRANAQRMLAERARQDDGSAALLAKLRQMDSELGQVRQQIAKSTASIIDNERRINELMALN
ncbi:TRAF3-interacting protein 1 [Aphelenchoides bicaudatus]|nr:TRAF3-interacting protein 1 [Aphelenchoides bicaudatus]